MATNGSLTTSERRKSNANMMTTGIEKRRKKQSPINITNDITEQDSKLKASKLKFSYTVGDLKTIEVTGEGFSCKTDDGCTSELTASHLPDVYKLWEFHAHWGTDKNCGSEHLINGKGFSAELHFVFWNKKYGEFKKCLKKCDGLTVLAVFMQEDSVENENFSPVIDGIHNSLGHLSRVDLEPKFDLLKLLPAKLSYYTYEGSLTSKPFHECVIWTILKHPNTISLDQLELLRQIIPGNCRLQYPLNERRVKRSFKFVKKSQYHVS
uniref:Carbonic anhydrase n=1 Tax=Onchocerca volvulus TaxID=6282 RepID=A0A8R1XT00_ONCVO